MISMDEAYSWLNVGDVSHLTPSNNLSIYQIADRALPVDHRDAVVRSLRTASENARDILETLEVKITLAKTCFENQDYAAAKIDLQDAVERYRPATHRLGVAKWMMGILLWQMKENDAAYNYWSGAKDIFTGLAEAEVRNHDINMVNWYYARIDAMRLDLVFTAEEAFYWLNFFENSHLSDPAKSFADEIRRRIQQKDYPLAYEIGRNLSRISHNRLDTNETAEAWVVIGLASLQMGNPRQAMDYLQRGAAAFIPWGHKQAVTRWMLGIAQWLIPEEADQAIRNWTNAIDAFNGLSVKADRENDQFKKDWYDVNISIMGRALLIKINGD